LTPPVGLHAWLRANVHAKGSLLGRDEIRQVSTGPSLEAEFENGVPKSVLESSWNNHAHPC
jgi:hypothetical protein